MNDSPEPSANGTPARFSFWALSAYWFKLFAQPLIAIVLVVGLAWLFGYLQRNHNWFNDSRTTENEEVESDSIYACSMLCVFVKAPGRCPVCGMDLQKVEQTGDPKDIYGLTLKPSSRRLANIKTVAALPITGTRTLESLGRIEIDESSITSIVAHVDGRVERMQVNFTGASVRSGEPVATLFAPELYADQIAFLQAKAATQSQGASSSRIQTSNKKLLESTRRRLVDLGIPENQIESIESSGTPTKRVTIESSVNGTVISKRTAEGDHVKSGEPILQIADLSKVWLVLQVIPDKAARLKLGESVDITIQSLPGQSFEGEISFISPLLDTDTQTVDVRIVISNESRLIKVGDLAKASLEIGDNESLELVSVPRDAVLANGNASVAYVETTPGRFEFRKVEIAETLNDSIAISSGIKPGELVVASGTFMLDSAFNMQGKASLIDPNRAIKKNEIVDHEEELIAEEIRRSFASLSAPDRKLAEAQVICPISEVKLGTHNMGTPIKVRVGDRDVMICCEGCRGSLIDNPDQYLAVLEKYHAKRGTRSKAGEPK